MTDIAGVDYVAKRCDVDFEIDGDIKKAFWQNSSWSTPFVDMATGKKPRLETRCAIRWNDSTLYIAFDVKEPRVEGELRQRDSLIFLENDVELFIDGGDSYYELELNALNTIYEVFFIWRDSFPNPTKFPDSVFNLSAPDVYTFGGDYDRTGENFWVGTHPRGVRWAFRGFDMPGLKTAVKVYGSLNDPQSLAEGWGVEISLPWSSLKPLANGRSLPPSDGDIWKFFLGRFQKEFIDGAEVQPHPASALRSHGVYDTHLPEQWSAVSFNFT